MRLVLGASPLSHWLDETARGFSTGRYTRAAVLRRAGLAAAGGLFASATRPAFAAQPNLNCGGYSCPSPNHCCDNRTCYDAITHQCCPLGATCFKDELCCGSTNCCASGSACCDSHTCYETSSEKCCPGGTPCKQDENCCGVDCCNPEFGEKCCHGVQCYDPGVFRCCPDGRRCTREAQECCEERCCETWKGEICCGGECCTSAQVCCGGECCEKDACVNGHCTTGRCTPAKIALCAKITPPEECCPTPGAALSCYRADLACCINGQIVNQCDGQCCTPDEGACCEKGGRLVCCRS